MNPPIPFLDLRPTSERAALDAAIRRVVDRGVFILGPEVESFEREFASASGAAYAVAVNSGTDALALLLRSCGIGRGDQVITTALGPAFTALAIVMTGATPVFVDIEADRPTIDPEQLERTVTPKTRAVLPVHLYGQPADVEAVAAFARARGLVLVEDCAQAHRATCGGRPVGTFGVGGAFSFYPTKNLGALGDGGAIITDDAGIAERVRRLRNGGQRERDYHEEAGVNSRLDELQAAVLRARLPHLADWTARRRQLAQAYRAGLDPAVVQLPPDDPGHVYHLFTVRSSYRDRLRAHLTSASIGTLVHYPVPVPQQPAFASMKVTCPNAERWCAEVVSLPLHPALAESDVRRVCDAVNGFGRQDAPEP